MRIHRHIKLLLLFTLIIQGGMFLGYPFQSNVDDNQSFQRYQIDRALDGDLLIGNLRYHSGYPLVMAPVAAVGRSLGRLDQRFLQLVQISLSALIPFLLYDVVRRRHSRHAALIVALLSLLDPFGLQWAQLSLPVWLVAFCFTLSFWLIQLSLDRENATRILAVAGIILGVATLARLNLAPIVALMGLIPLFATGRLLRKRLIRVFVLGSSSLLVLCLYFVLIHVPSTGTLSPGCVAGTNLLESLGEAGVPIVASNGPATTRLLRLITIPATRSIVWTNEIYPRWQEPGSWATPAEYAAFFSQPYGEEFPQQTDISFFGTLVYYLGPCETDSLQIAVAAEAFAAQPLRLLATLPGEVLELLHQQSFSNLPIWHLPHVDSLRFEKNGDLPFLWRAWSQPGGAYRGTQVWYPAMVVYAQGREFLNLVKVLVIPALLWAFFSRRPLYVTAAVLLLAWLFMLALIDGSEARIIAPLWPLWSLLSGGMLAALWQRLPFRPDAAPGCGRRSC